MRPTRAIVLVDHGSRQPEANAVLAELATLVQARAPDRIVHHAHMELAHPSLAEAIDRCVRDGATEIVVHPYFLAPGRHASEDIPRLAREAAAEHAQVTVRVSPPLGLHEKLAEVVLERVDG